MPVIILALLGVAMKKLARIEKTLPLIGNMLLPAFMFACALFSFYINGSYSDFTITALHSGLYLTGLTGFLVLLYFNRSKPIFMFLLIVLSYILINYLKRLYGAEYCQTAAYLSLSTLIPLNMLLFYFFPARSFFNKKNLWLLLAVFAQYSVVELSARHNFSFGFFSSTVPTINIAALGAFTLLLLITLTNAVRSGAIYDYNCFFAYFSLLLAFYYSDSASGLCVFCTTAALCLLSSLIQNIYNEAHKDTLTGLDSRKSYIIHSKNFPLKYSIGIVSIDDYDKLGINFGRRIQNILTKLIATQIINLEKDENIYRYNADEFVIVYKNMDKNESFERLEIIRRAVASALFEFSPRRKPIKLTVSAGVSEKKRSDANSFEVLVRANKILQKTRSFSHNVTSKA